MNTPANKPPEHYNFPRRRGKLRFSGTVRRNNRMKCDKNKIDEYTLALLFLVICERREGFGGRAWKGFDWDTLNRLHEKGFISDPIGKAKSVHLTEAGCKRAKALFWKHFGTPEE